MVARTGWVICLCFAVAGCGGAGSRGSVVSGKVTQAGAPVTGGMILFHPLSGTAEAANGTIMADGVYEVKGVVPGEYKVTVETEYLKAAATPVRLPNGVTPPPSSAQLNNLKYVKIDAKYGKVAETDLKTTVAGSTHTYDIVIK